MYLYDYKYFRSIGRRAAEGLFRHAKRAQKTVDLDHGSVYIHECHPFKGSPQQSFARPSVVSCIIPSLGSIVGAPVRFAFRRKWEQRAHGFPGRQSAPLMRHKPICERAKVRQDF